MIAPTTPVTGDSGADRVLVPRDLLAAACHCVRKYAGVTSETYRRLSVLSLAPAAPAQPEPARVREYEQAYFERGFIAAAAWAMTKRADDVLSDAVIDHAWAHRDEGMDEGDVLPVRAATPPETREPAGVGEAQPAACDHDIRWPHPCTDCDAVPPPVGYDPLAKLGGVS